MKLAIFLLSLCAIAQEFGPLHPAMMKSTRGPVRAGLVAGYDLKSVNLLKYSEDVTAGGGGVQSTASAIQNNVALSPFNENTADSILVTEAQDYSFAGPRVQTDNYATLNGLAVTFSVYMKASAPATARLANNTSVSGEMNVTTGWTRFNFSFTGAAFNYLKILPPQNITLYYSCMQINEGSTALPYVATTDLQTVPNMVAGGAALTLGSTSGVDANDPTRTLSGMVFDGVDDYLTTTLTSFTPSGMTQYITSNTNDVAGDLIVANSTGGMGLAVTPGVLLQGYFAAPNNRSKSATIVSNGSTWYSLAGVYANSPGAGRLFINGVETEYNSQYTGGQSLGPVTTVTIGGPTTREGYLSGTISYVLIYNRVLSPKEIRQNHQWLKGEMAKVGVSLP